MEHPIEYFIAQARRISETSADKRIKGVLFNSTIGAVASGTLYGHETVPDGRQIRTSRIVAAYAVNGFRIIETKNGSSYLLAKIGPSKTFRDQWGILQEHLNVNDEALASLPKSDFSTFGPELLQAARVARNPAFAAIR